MELIREAYYLQFMMVVLNILDFIGTIFYIPFVRFLSPINLILNAFHPRIVNYVLILYYFILLFPMILANFYIIKKRDIIRNYSKYLILFSYIMLGIIITTNFRSIINVYYYNNFQLLENTIVPFIRDILGLITSILTFGSIIFILLIPNYKNLKIVKIWMIAYYMSYFIIVVIFRYLPMNTDQVDIYSNIFSLTQPIILLFIIRSLFLFARDDADLINDQNT